MRIRRLGIAAAAGAGLAYVFRRRAAMLARRAERAGRAVGARMYGVVSDRPPKDYNDETLAQKIESEILGPAHISRGQVKVNVQRGLVQLRGTMQTPELIADLVHRIREVHGVRDVESLLHVPTTDAPMHQ